LSSFLYYNLRVMHKYLGLNISLRSKIIPTFRTIENHISLKTYLNREIIYKLDPTNKYKLILEP